MLRFYSEFMGKSDLAFDVGASLGNRTDVFLKLGATVVAVEPQDACVQQLRKKYQNDRRVIIVQKALGDKEGKAELMVSDGHQISSLSREWISSVKASGRFSMYRWDKSVIVSVTTLDNLVEEYGKPAFCKIDVEGFEFEVLKGLSHPIGAISFEFTPEFIDRATDCIERLDNMGVARFNYSLGESMRLSLRTWVEAEEIVEVLMSLPDKTVFGDVYAKFVE